MQIRVDKITRIPGWIKSGATYTFILEGDNLYLLRTGKYVDFEKVAPFLDSRMAAYPAAMMSKKIIDSMYGGRIKEIDEVEQKISTSSLNECAKEKDCFLLHKADIEGGDFNLDYFTLKLKTKQGSFKFYFSTMTDRGKAREILSYLN